MTTKIAADTAHARLRAEVAGFDDRLQPAENDGWQLGWEAATDHDGS